MPFLELMFNAVEITVSVLVLLALWDGRPVGGGLIRRWLRLRTVASADEIERFLRRARRPAPQIPDGRRAAASSGADSSRRVPATGRRMP